MDFKIYLIGRLIVAMLAFGLLSSILFALRQAFAKLKVNEIRKRWFIGFVMGALILWLMILGLLSLGGFFQDFDKMPPRVMFATMPPLVVTLILLFSKKFRLILLATPPAWLVYIQAFRILMELFLWLGFRGGYVPPQMTFAWLNFDIVVGLTAPMAGYVFFGTNRFFRFQGLLWNFFGIALLLNIILISVLSTPSQLQVFFNEPANRFVADFPFIWIPGFIVPFALAMHLFSIKQLLMFNPNRRQFNLRRDSSGS